MDSEKKEILIRVYRLFDEIFISEIEESIQKIDSYGSEKFPDETIILFKNSFQSLLVALEMYNRDDLINSICILRSSLENLLCSLAISVDEETLRQYRYRDWDVYKDVLQKKNDIEKRKNPKYKPIKININDYKMKPNNIRKTIIDNHSKVLPNFFDEKFDKPEKDLKEFYSYLSSLVHPSIVKTCTYKMQENITELSNVKILFKVNIYYLAMMLISAYSYITGEEVTIQLELISLTTLLSFSLVEEIKDIKKVARKYRDYLYFNVNQHCIEKQKEAIKELEKEIKEFQNDERLNEVIISLFQKIFKFYNISKI